MSDLVERLRRLEVNTCVGAYIDEAADEIERLTTKLGKTNSYLIDNARLAEENVRLCEVLQEIVDEDDGYWGTGAIIAGEALAAVAERQSQE